MERIQSALKKARASRGGVNASSMTRTRKAVANTAGHNEALSQSWAALEQFAPNAKTMKRNRIVTFEGGAPAVHFDMLRTKILQQMQANNWRRVAITSPGSSCGKTTTVVNLAFGLARQDDQRVVVAEMDLRRPGLAKTLGLKGGVDRHQFSRVLRGEDDLSSHMVRYNSNLAFGTNASAARNPSELLQSSAIVDVLAEIEERLQPTVTLFDMPPMLVSDDTIAFLGQVDCVLLVAAAEASTMDEVDQCERELSEQTNVLGIVLNKCRYMGKKYGYAYYE